MDIDWKHVGLGLLAALLASCGGSAGPAAGGNFPAQDTGSPPAAAPTSTTWRPFAASSPWNTPVAAGAAVDPDSAALIADLKTSSAYGPNLTINIAGYSIPLSWADASTPTYQVSASLGGDGWIGTDGLNAVGTMPIPDDAAPDPEGDHHLLVIDRARGLEWGCWAMQWTGAGWQAGVCATSDLAGTGVRPPAPEAQPWWSAHGARACGFPLVAGLIRVDEIRAGRIDHALAIAYPHIRSRYFTPPASTAAGTTDVSTSTRGIPCGGRLQYDPTVDLDTLSLSRSGRIVLEALQRYGAYVGDYSGAISLYAENARDAQASWSGGVLGSDELAGKIDLARFRVLRSGALYDNGN